MIIAIRHSALDSEWKKHKYVAKEDGKYYYPDGTKGARTISSLKKKRAKDTTSDKSSKDTKKRKAAINKLAKSAISGKYGNGEERKKKLGKRYTKVQNRVNEILLGKKEAKLISDSKKAKETGRKALEKVTKKKSTTKKSTEKDTKKKSTTKKSTEKTSTRSSSGSTKKDSSRSTSKSKTTSSGVSKTSTVALKRARKESTQLVKKAKKQALANARLRGRIKALRKIAAIRR